MVVYIVTSGEYSDYHIERVFLSYEKAEQFVALHNRNSDEYCYEEWNIEPRETFDECLSEEIKVYYLYTFYCGENDNKLEYYSEPRIVGFEKKEAYLASYGWVILLTLESENIEKAYKMAEEELAKARAEKESE